MVAEETMTVSNIAPAQKLTTVKNLYNPYSITHGDIIVKYGFEVNNEFKGIIYYDLDKYTKKEILQQFFGSYWEQFDLNLMVINNDIIPPHTDSNVKTVINIYIETGSAITHFYKPITNNITTYKISNQTDGHIYHPKDLIETFNFTAQQNEAWILDVSQIHSVTGSKNPRIAYCIISNLPMEKVLALYNDVHQKNHYYILLLIIIIIIVCFISFTFFK